MSQKMATLRYFSLRYHFQPRYEAPLMDTINMFSAGLTKNCFYVGFRVTGVELLGSTASA
jgi:hypothetical protein